MAKGPEVHARPNFPTANPVAAFVVPCFFFRFPCEEAQENARRDRGNAFPVKKTQRASGNEEKSWAKKNVNVLGLFFFFFGGECNTESRRSRNFVLLVGRDNGLRASCGLALLMPKLTFDDLLPPPFAMLPAKDQVAFFRFATPGTSVVEYSNLPHVCKADEPGRYGRGHARSCRPVLGQMKTWSCRPRRA